MRKPLMVPAAGFRVRPMALRAFMERRGAHWFRRFPHDVLTNPSDAPCAMSNCGRPGREHWTWCGEWRLPRRQRYLLSIGRMIALYRRDKAA